MNADSNYKLANTLQANGDTMNELLGECRHSQETYKQMQTVNISCHITCKQKQAKNIPTESALKTPTV